jgi:hypothetical protein
MSTALWTDERRQEYPTRPLTLAQTQSIVAAMGGLLQFDAAAMAAWRRDLAAYYDEFRPPRSSLDASVYATDNDQYPPGDALVLYATVRHLKPARVLEIGSGHSTKVVVAAGRRNPVAPVVTCIEPYRSDVLAALGAAVSVVAEPLETVVEDGARWLRLVDDLQANDILFVDSSHVVRPYGDVLVATLAMMPRLRRGVYVHIHDFFYPSDYHRRWMFDERRGYTEQYLVAAFLHGNPSWRIVAHNFLAMTRADMADTAWPDGLSRNGGSLWLVKVE